MMDLMVWFDMDGAGQDGCFSEIGGKGQRAKQL